MLCFLEQRNAPLQRDKTPPPIGPPVGRGWWYIMVEDGILLGDLQHSTSILFCTIQFQKWNYIIHKIYCNWIIGRNSFVLFFNWKSNLELDELGNKITKKKQKQWEIIQTNKNNVTLKDQNTIKLNRSESVESMDIETDNIIAKLKLENVYKII